MPTKHIIANSATHLLIAATPAQVWHRLFPSKMDLTATYCDSMRGSKRDDLLVSGMRQVLSVLSQPMISECSPDPVDEANEENQAE